MDDSKPISSATPPSPRRRPGPVKRNGPLILGTLATTAGGLIAPLGLGIALLAIGKIPHAVLWTIATVVVVATFVVGALVARAGTRKSAQSILDARASERQLTRARQELAAMEQLIADRTIEYADLGERLREASAMLRLSEEQTTSVRRAIESAIERSKRAWWLALLAFLSGVALDYFVNWTSGAWKPPWIP